MRLIIIIIIIVIIIILLVSFWLDFSSQCLFSSSFTIRSTELHSVVVVFVFRCLSFGTSGQGSVEIVSVLIFPNSEDFVVQLNVFENFKDFRKWVDPKREKLNKK